MTMQIPQKPEIPETIPGLPEAEAVAQRAHAMLADAEERLAVNQREAVQGNARRDVLQERVAKGETVEAAEIAAVDAAIQEAESMAGLLAGAIPKLREQIEAAERNVCRLAEKANAEMVPRTKAYLEEARRFQEDVRTLLREAAHLHASFAPSPATGLIGDGLSPLQRFAPTSAARQKAWKERKDREALAARAEADAQRAQRAAEERRIEEREMKEYRAQKARDDQKFWLQRAGLA
ncbi:hypothetical protein [Roseomonas chloroacetimidivorans]|uniref:hypothetical protein n=1 Tax=Roseomonas chloroacetimidivorans TaxID=1766656 RepID=UPI003C76FC42